MKPAPLLGAVLAAAVSCGHAQDADWREVGLHMRLIDDLDRPADDCCLDVVGSGRNS